MAQTPEPPAQDGAMLRRIAQRQPLLPVLAAELFIERLGSLGPAADSTLPFDLGRKRDAVAAAVRLTLLNGDMLGQVRRVLVRSDVPVANAARSPEFIEAARVYLVAALQEVSDGAFQDIDPGVCDEVGAVVIAALFGPGDDALNDAAPVRSVA